MNTIDSALRHAVQDVRGRVNQVPRRAVTHLQGRRRRQRASHVALGMAFVAGLTAVAIMSSSPGAVLPMGGRPPIVLGDGHVWPERPMEGDPVEVALAFASEVLGWSDAIATEDPPGDPAGPVWVRLAHELAIEPVMVLVGPVAGEGRALFQVSSGPALSIAIGVIEPGQPGTRLTVPVLSSAVSAEATLRVGDGEHLTVTADLTGGADATEVTLHSSSNITVATDRTEAAGSATHVEIPLDDPWEVRSVLVRYLDSDGRTVGAVGGHFFASGDAPPELFPHQTRVNLDESGCRNTDSIERLVAEASAPDGVTHQFWITSANEAATPNGYILVELLDDGSVAGFSIACSPPGLDTSEYYGEVWAMAPNKVSAQGAVASVMGRVPAGATTAVVTFSDGTSVEIETLTDGYFLRVVSRPDITGDAVWPDVVRVSALDSNGMLLAEEEFG